MNRIMIACLLVAPLFSFAGYIESWKIVKCDSPSRGYQLPLLDLQEYDVLTIEDIKKDWKDSEVMGPSCEITYRNSLTEKSSKQSYVDSSRLPGEFYFDMTSCSFGNDYLSASRNYRSHHGSSSSNSKTVISNKEGQFIIEIEDDNRSWGNPLWHYTQSCVLQKI